MKCIREQIPLSFTCMDITKISILFILLQTERKLILAETEIAYSDSLHTLDTLIIYQIIGCTDTSEKQKTLVKKEFLRFGKKYETVFRSSTFQEYKNNSSDGQIKNYFVGFSSISPLSIAWAKLPEEYKCVFTITLRIKVRENRAELPISPDDF